MSKGARNRRNRPEPEPGSIARTFAHLDGVQIPGGCDDCDAYQVLELHAFGPNAHRIGIYHDDGCPTLRRYTRPPAADRPTGSTTEKETDR